MTLVDDQGRLFGRWNLVDAMIGVALLTAIPLIYGGYLLFRPSMPSLASIEPARILQGTNPEIRIRGGNLRPYMRISFGTHQGQRFLFANENEAVVPIGEIPPGSYDVILWDYAQERARIPNGLEVVATPRAETQLELIGAFTGVTETVAAAITDGVAAPPLGQVTRVAARQPSSTRTSLGATLVDVPSPGLFNVPAVIRGACSLVVRGGSAVCMAGDTLLMDDAVLRVTLAGASAMFQVDQLRLDGPGQTLAVRVRFAGDRAALDLMRNGHRDVRRQNELAAAATISELGGARQAPTSVGVAIPAGPGMLQPFVVTELSSREATLQVPAQRVADQWTYAARTIKAGGTFTFNGPDYEVRGVVLSVSAAKP